MMRTTIGTVLALLALVPGIAQAQTEQVFYYHTDAIGSVRMITDETGQVVARYDYRPFGDPCGSLCGPPSAADKRQFAGKERDQETGFDYFGARYYGSGSGRFTSMDPVSVTAAHLSNPQRLNRYAYALNNPLRYIDPQGLDVITYDEYGNEIEREKQSKWHNFWFGDTYRMTAGNETFNLADRLKPLSNGDRYTVINGTETSQLMGSFLAAQSPGTPGQTLSYSEIVSRATHEWNWKLELNRSYGPNALFMLEGMGQRSDYLGNYAFGYLMNAWGSSASDAKWGGAFFNLFVDPWQSGANPFKGSIFSGYDDPRDFTAINAGAALYRRRTR